MQVLILASLSTAEVVCSKKCFGFSKFLLTVTSGIAGSNVLSNHFICVNLFCTNSS